MNERGPWGPEMFPSGRLSYEACISEDAYVETDGEVQERAGI